MVAEIKDSFRAVLQKAIDNESARLMQQQQEEALEKFMGNHEPHPMGTVADLAEEFGISKKHIRRMKQDGTLEDFINERR